MSKQQMLVMDKPIKFNRSVEIVNKSEFLSDLFKGSNIIETKSTEIAIKEINKNNKMLIEKINENNKKVSDDFKKFIEEFTEKIDLSQIKDVDLRLKDSKDEINKIIKTSIQQTSDFKKQRKLLLKEISELKSELKAQRKLLINQKNVDTEIDNLKSEFKSQQESLNTMDELQSDLENQLIEQKESMPSLINEVLNERKMRRKKNNPN